MIMPLSRSMQQALEQRNFDEAIRLFRADSTMVNQAEDNSERLSLFQRALSCKEDTDTCKNFLELIVTHPGFNLNYTNGLNNSNLQSMILATEADLVRLVRDKSRFCVNNQQLSYVFAMGVGAKVDMERVRLKEANPNDPLLHIKEQEFDRIVDISEVIYEESLKKAHLFPLLRDAMISHAIDSDNPRMLDNLGAKGIDLSQPMENGRLPYDCITEDQPELLAYKAKQLARSRAAQADPAFFRRSAASILNAWAEEEKASDKEIAALTKRYEKERDKVVNELVDNNIEFINSLIEEEKRKKEKSICCVIS